MPTAFAEELNLEWDSNGNFVTGDGFYRIYDEFNHLIQIRSGNNASAPLLYSFTWEPLEEKVFIKDEYFPNDTLKSSTYYVSEEYIHIQNSSGNYSEVYIWQDGVLVAFENTNGQKRFVLTDHLGSVTVVMDEQGNVIERTFYSPFGEILEGGKESRYTFTGKEFDPITREYDFGSRRYKPEWGIFLQPDRVFYDLTIDEMERMKAYYTTQRTNPYSYGINNPYRNVDPSGNVPIDTIADVGFIGYDAYLLITEGSGEDDENVDALFGDLAGAATPYATGFGSAVRAGKLSDKAMSTTKNFERAFDSGRLSKTTLQASKIGTIAYKNLPSEAQKTIKTIEKGGPFPYRRDNTIFKNREGQLPKQPESYYKEYTVKTKGTLGRGSQRLVVGKKGEVYYTKDHYKSFSKVTKSGSKKK